MFSYDIVNMKRVNLYSIWAHNKARIAQWFA